ncbi:DUF6542 domain-containing protein [Streptacidiphilus sp. EB129]|uniref:DUF6542 domain-containing protein n=1 Tax=Streptacidiphilus sp. EB129 TaxID=3156262 RepID=UPI003514FE4E
MSDPRLTDRPVAAAVPGRPAAVPGPARSPEPRGGGTVRPPQRPAPRPGGVRTPHRLTAVGSGVVMLAATFLGGAADYWLFDGSGYVLGLVYLAACFQVAVRVRPVDLAAAPISGPIAFAITLLVVQTAPTPGWTGELIGLATALALQAGWLFAGTILAALIVLARHIALNRGRR